jgi:ATP-binding cassette subfamily B protein
MFKITKFALKLFIKTQPGFFLFILLLGIPHGLLHSVSTFVFSHQLFDAVGGVITNGEPLSRAYIIIIAAAFVFIIREIMECIYNFLFNMVLFHKPGRELKKMVHAKMARIDPVCLEDPNFHDSIEKADSGAEAVLGMVSYIVVLLNVYIPYFIFMSFYLNNLQPYLLWIIALVFIPTLLSQLVKTGVIAKFEDKAAPIRRECD